MGSSCAPARVLELAQPRRGVRREVALGHGRVGHGAAPEQAAPDIAPVLPKQAQRAVLGMALAQDEDALAMLARRDRPAGARGTRADHDPVSGGDDGVLRHVVDPRVGDHHRLRQAVRERVPRILDRAREHPAALDGARHPFDPVEQERRGVGGQAREERRGHRRRGPFEQARQVWPVGLVAKLHLRRLGSGDDQGVRGAPPQLLETGVACVDQRRDRLRAGDLGDRVQLEGHVGAVGRARGGVPELLLGVDEGRVRHVVDERDPHAQLPRVPDS